LAVRRFAILVTTLSILAAACGGSDADISAVPELPPVTGDEMAALLAASDQPVVLNVWASWCIPCRSEAPLLERAAEQFADDVTFVGVNVRDSQTGAREFIAEFFPTAAIDHFFDRSGEVPIALGGNTGVPLTFFYAPGGELVHVQSGVIDERTLALQIDEILARTG
jgi:cytochrome c biogenesis protein CcmG/thiol:disulfide interchange protein DsbE